MRDASGQGPRHRDGSRGKKDPATTALERALIIVVLLVIALLVAVAIDKPKTCGVVLYEDGSWVPVDEPARSNFQRGLPPGCRLVVEK